MAIHGVDRGGGGAGGVSDGDKGDVTVSGSGAVWNLDAGVVGATELASDAVTTVKILDANVTLAKQANLANATVIGRNTAGTGVPEAVTMTQLQTLLNVSNGVTYSFAVKKSSQVFASATPANVTSLVLNLVSGHFYKFKLSAIVQTDTNTVGIQAGFTTPTFNNYAAQAATFSSADGTAGVFFGRLNSSGDTMVPNQAPAANADQTMIIEGMITPTANGSLQFQMATETGTTNVTIFTGVLELWDYGT